MLFRSNMVTGILDVDTIPYAISGGDSSEHMQHTASLMLLNCSFLIDLNVNSNCPYINYNSFCPILALLFKHSSRIVL